MAEFFASLHVTGTRQSWYEPSEYSPLREREHTKRRYLMVGSVPRVYKVVKEGNVPAKMRDGVTLYADIYRPDAPGRFPVLLMRTPYNKAGFADVPEGLPRELNYVSDYAERFVPRGY